LWNRNRIFTVAKPESECIQDLVLDLDTDPT